MNKMLKKVMLGVALCGCFGTVGGTVLPSLKPIEAKASNLNYHTDYDNLKMQTIYTQDNKAIVVVNVGKNALETGGVTFECRTSNYNYTSYTSLAKAGTRTWDNGNSVTSVYNSNTGKYEVTFTIYKDTIYDGARGYFYVYGNYSGVIMDENGGYGYQIF